MRIASPQIPLDPGLTKVFHIAVQCERPGPVAQSGRASVMFDLFGRVGDAFTSGIMNLWEATRKARGHSRPWGRVPGSNPGGPATFTEWLYHFFDATHAASGTI